jgi:hypothetical protein
MNTNDGKVLGTLLLKYNNVVLRKQKWIGEKNVFYQKTFFCKFDYFK